MLIAIKFASSLVGIEETNTSITSDSYDDCCSG